MKRETIDLFNRIFKVLEPPPDLTLSQWADRYRRLSSESGSKGGKWNTEKAPWQREIMDAITDISVEKVVVMSAAQMGKTDAFLLNTIGYYMHYDPCTILCMQPTDSYFISGRDRCLPTNSRSGGGPSDTCRETTYNILESKRGRHKHANDKRGKPYRNGVRTFYYGGMECTLPELRRITAVGMEQLNL